MSELKSVYIDRTGDWARSGNDTGQFYLKSEADKVIAELEESHKKEVEQLILTIEQCKRAARTLRKKMEHSNYKRCFNMARWCISMMVFNSKYGTDKKWHLFKKWHKRWLELAEKFKEA